MQAVSRPMTGRGGVTSFYKVALGRWVQSLRLEAGLTQEELTARVDMGWASGVSAIENGRNVIPPERLLAFADALGVEPRIFAAKVLRYTHPHAFALLFRDDPRAAFAEVQFEVPDRVASTDGGAMRSKKPKQKRAKRAKKASPRSV